MNIRTGKLKAHLTGHTRKAAGDDQVRFADRGRPVGKSEGLGGTSLLERRIAKGWMTPPERAVVTSAIRYNAPLDTPGAIDEDRG
ncbi:MAG: hypothetical protein OXF41_00080 [bacterium]|nr:hypothetical protein [bacterium]